MVHLNTDLVISPDWNEHAALGHHRRIRPRATQGPVLVSLGERPFDPGEFLLLSS